MGVIPRFAKEMIMSESLPKIRINQTGYHTSLNVRMAVLTDGPLTVTDESGNIVKTIEYEAPSFDEASGDNVRLLDLGILPAGKYFAKAGTESREFVVSESSPRDVADALVKGLYFQRCGMELEEKYAGIYKHPACHTAEAADWEDNSKKRLVTGGWHDAGDYGKYVGPGAVTAAHLIYSDILFPSCVSDNLNIPESGNGVPDILNEARYELDWMLKMQREDGAFHHKLTKARFAPFIMPEEDLLQEYLMPVSHTSTGAACACLALSYRAYKKYDADFALRCLDSAVRAWKWLEENPDFEPYKNPEGVNTGGYGDRNLTDELFWAACELYAATGDEKYLKSAEELFSEDMLLAEFGWANVGGLGALCVMFELKETAGDLYLKVKNTFLRQSKKALEVTRLSGYGTAIPSEGYIWGSILTDMNNAMSMAVSFLLTGDTEMLDGAMLQWDYALGLNALDICFVTGFGERRVMNPHHRPSGSDDITDPVPGLISGGPNKRYTYPQTKEKLGEDVPPAKYFLDELPSADTNEIAIYWNSPVVFVGAFLLSEAAKKDAR